jgi:MoxR-like ATPase
MAERALEPAPAEVLQSITANLGLVVHAPEDSLRLVVLCLVAEGHLIVEDFPGVGKTMLAKALSRSVDCRFARLQFTPDLLPSDVTGVNVFNQQRNEFEFRPGPVFANLLLVDEVNRASPKTQAALLECMQESQVTIDGESHPLERPFMVVATQNPIEYEGTYPLPEAQLDRFLLKLEVGYPGEAAERRILELEHDGVRPAGLDQIEAVVSLGDLRAARALVARTTVSGEVLDYLLAVVRATRSLPSVELGASPRASVHLLAATKAWARLDGRDFATPDDVAAMARPALRHRLLLRPEAELERFRPDDAIEAALRAVPVPR